MGEGPITKAKPGKLYHAWCLASFFIMVFLRFPIAYAGGISGSASADTASLGSILIPIQFGIIVVLNCGIGLLTPPVGAVLFIGSAVKSPGAQICGFPIRAFISGLAKQNLR